MPYICLVLQGPQSLFKSFLSQEKILSSLYCQENRSALFVVDRAGQGQAGLGWSDNKSIWRRCLPKTDFPFGKWFWNFFRLIPLLCFSRKATFYIKLYAVYALYLPIFPTSNFSASFLIHQFNHIIPLLTYLPLSLVCLFTHKNELIFESSQNSAWHILGAI